MNNADVKKILEKAYADASSGKSVLCKSKGLIDFVLDNTHLTYKYILVTALASKATDESINPLCLQAKSSLPGAYDARTVCHGVIVPFEKNTLGKALGGSNEPFLNKPARFTELSKDNAVRRGNDQTILYRLVDDLPKITTKEEAYSGLVYAMKKLIAVREEKAALTEFSLENLDSNAATLYSFIDKLLCENYEGEILTLVVAGLFEQYMVGHDNYKVEVHPVNESGASSKEISDLDIYLDGKLFVSNELKDKDFTDHDMEHAADKVIAAGKGQINFVIGRHGGCPQKLIVSTIRKYLAKGFVINVIPVDFFVLTILSMINTINIEYFLKYILATARDTKFKETTISFIQSVAADSFDFSGK